MRNRTSKQVAIIDAVITTSGRFDMLIKCLDALYREAQETPLNIYIVDIFSPAEDRIQNQTLFEYDEEKDPKGNVNRFETKRLQSDVGFPQGANEGARMGSAPLVMFISDDVELFEGTLSKIIKRFDDPTIGVVGTKNLFPLNSISPNRPSGRIQHIGHAVNIRGEIIHPLVGWSKDNPKCCVSRDVFSVTGACLTIRRNLLNKVGMFNTIYGLGTFEDVELCMSVRKMGARVFVDTDCLAYHYVGASAEKINTPFPIQQNRQIFLSRWQTQTEADGQPLFFWDEWTYY